MKTIMYFYIVSKLALFLLCLMIFFPIAAVNPEWFINGILGFCHRQIDSLEKHRCISKDQAEKMRKELNV